MTKMIIICNNLLFFMTLYIRKHFERMIIMKKIIAVAFTAILLLTGCGKVDEKVRIEQSTNSQSTNNNEKTVTKIKIAETGGEDGRDNEWDVFQIDGCNIVIQKDNRSCKTVTYHISDEDYQILMDMDFSSHLKIQYFLCFVLIFCIH